jgi:hypothetical protein
MKSISSQRSQSGKHVLLAAMVLGVFGVASPAAAQEACGESECPKGYSCEDVPAACPAIACAEGSECPPCEGTVEQCVPQSCDSDADCDEQMVCLTRTITECASAEPACDPGPDCASAPPSDCSAVSFSACVPRWTLNCVTAADCGEGFSCEEQMSCSSPGSPPSGTGAGTPGSVPPSDGGSEPAKPGGSGGSGGAQQVPTPPPDSAERPSPGSGGSGGAQQVPTPPDAQDRPPPVTTCEPTGVKACVVIERACSADSQCPSGWSCEDNPDGVCWASSDGSTGCEPADPAKLCLPPYRDLGGGGYGETTSAGKPTTPDGSSSPPGNPASGSPGEEPLPSSELASDQASLESESSGCSMVALAGGSASGAGLSVFGALLAFALRRSRSRAESDRRSASR